MDFFLKPPKNLRFSLKFVHRSLEASQGGLGYRIELALIVDVLIPYVELNVQGFNEKDLAVMLAGEHKPLEFSPGRFNG
jgi:uncharacterized protein YhjY with autotransporter beta-barrel domain